MMHFWNSSIKSIMKWLKFKIHMQASFCTKKALPLRFIIAFCSSLPFRCKKKCRIRSWAAVAARIWFEEIRERAPGIKKPAWNEGVRGKCGGWRRGGCPRIEPGCVNTCACAYISPGNWKSINAELGRKVESPMRETVSRRAISTWDVRAPSSRYRVVQSIRMY